MTPFFRIVFFLSSLAYTAEVAFGAPVQRNNINIAGRDGSVSFEPTTLAIATFASVVHGRPGHTKRDGTVSFEPTTLPIATWASVANGPPGHTKRDGSVSFEPTVLPIATWASIGHRPRQESGSAGPDLKAAPTRAVNVSSHSS